MIHYAILLASILMLATPETANASMVDLRFSVHNLNLQKTDEINEYNGTAFPQLEKMNGYSADAMASLPAMPVLLGVRYERYQAKGSNDAGRYEAKFERQSIIVAKRLIDSAIYAGVLMTVGFNNEFSYRKVDALDVKYKATSGATATLGAELGLKMALLRIGLEGGYMYAPLGSLKYSNNGNDVTNAQNESLKVSLEGPYARAVLGFGF